MSHVKHVPNPGLDRPSEEQITANIAKWGQVHPSVREQIEAFIVRRDDKVGDVGIEISRYCEPFIDPTRWM
jgi:hypothetical protein